MPPTQTRTPRVARNLKPLPRPSPHSHFLGFEHTAVGQRDGNEQSETDADESPDDAGDSGQSES